MPRVKAVLLVLSWVVAAVGVVPSALAVCPDAPFFETPVAHTTGPNPHFMVTGDFNEDGRVDLAVTNADLPNAGSVASSVGILLGTGPRTFASAVTYPVGAEPHGIVAADFNEDGVLDLATANKYGGSVSILLGQGAGGIGTGSFAPAVDYPVGGYGFQVVAADFNGDGILDLGVSLNSVAAVAILLGQGVGGVGNGAFGAATLFPLSGLATGLVLGDFNEDGIHDLVATEYFPGTVAVLIGSGSGGVGDGAFLPAVHYSVGSGSFDVSTADFNEDGITDLAVATGSGTTILVGLGAGGVGTGAFANGGAIPSGNAADAVPIDANADGIMDVAVCHFTGADNGVVKVYLGQESGGVPSGTFSGPSTYDIGADPYQVVVADMDLDGRQDLVVAAALRTHVALLYGICAPGLADPRNPVLTDVRDVPNDDGGRVFLTWTSSSLDRIGGPVTSYRVWRRIAPGFAGQVAGESALDRFKAIPVTNADGATTIEYWEAIITLPAERLAGYGFTAPTTQDSMRTSNPYTAFFVTALTSDIDAFYPSNVDSGYSVDNLPPRRPGAFAGEPGPGSGFILQWEESEASDLSGYRLYRGTTESFALSEEHLIATLTDAGYVDEGGGVVYFYKLTAVDVHENESEPAVVGPPAVSDVSGSGSYSLAIQGIQPNPSRTGVLGVSFSLPTPASARLRIVDVGGREVGAKDLMGLGAGAHRVSLGGTRTLAPGIYLVELIQGSRSVRSKAVVMP